MKKTLLKLLLTCFCMASPVLSQATDKPGLSPGSLQQIITGDHRSKENQHRDQYRHPEQTLAFFEVEDDMTVVEVWPGKGWYTEILAPYLREKGRLYVAHFSPANTEAYFQDNLKAYLDKLHNQPKLYDKVEVTVLQPPKEVNIASENSADRVLTFRNVHNWMHNDQAASVFSAMFRVLKPGGILGIVEHRGSSLKPQDPKAVSGYVNEDYVIDLARKAGFEFLAKSEINANPKDTKNYPGGVWTLPPTLKLKDKDKEKYLAIGESDRMTIKFIKPQPHALANLFPKGLFPQAHEPKLGGLPEVIHNRK